LWCLNSESNLYQRIFKALDPLYIAAAASSTTSASSSASSSSARAPTAKTSASKLDNILRKLFEPLEIKLEKLCGIENSDSSIDGMEMIGILVVLQQYMFDHMGTIFPDRVRDDQPNAAPPPTRPVGDHYTPYLASLLSMLRAEMLKRIKTYTNEQLSWIEQQTGDPKKAGVAVPVTKFPSFVKQALEMTGAQRMPFVDEMLFQMAKKILQWIEGLAALNDKYADVVRIQNFGFFANSVGSMGVTALETLVSFASQQAKEAEARYVLWMVSYSFPQLSALMMRMDSVGSRVRDEELALYVRRKDVLSVVKELDIKALPPMIRTWILFLLFGRRSGTAW
jgi:Exocyst complex component Sec3